MQQQGDGDQVESRNTVGVREAIRFARIRKGLSARALSRQAGLSPSYAGKLEAGEIEPSLRAFGQLAIVLGLSEVEVFFCVVTEARSPSPELPLKIDTKETE